MQMVTLEIKVNVLPVPLPSAGFESVAAGATLHVSFVKRTTARQSRHLWVPKVDVLTYLHSSSELRWLFLVILSIQPYHCASGLTT